MTFVVRWATLRANAGRSQRIGDQDAVTSPRLTVTSVGPLDTAGMSVPNARQEEAKGPYKPC